VGGGESIKGHINKLGCRMGLAKGRIELYSAFRQPHLAFADFYEIRPFSFVEMAGERRNGALFDLLPASFWPFFHFGNTAFFSAFCQPHFHLG
jgi:hypothetical protein